MTPFFLSRFAFVTIALGAASLAQATTPTHYYGLNGSFADALGGPSLAPQGGTLEPTGYTFGANQGLSLSGALPESTYTIDTTFSFDQTSGYRRIVDFKNRASDTGLYNLSGALNFYNITTGGAGAITAGQSVRVTISRDGATNLVSGYVGGVLALSFTDSGNLATFSAASNIAYFFVDDSAIGNEASSGFVDYISIYDQALTASEIATLPQPIPEPATGALMLVGLAAAAAAARRRKA